MRISDWSSDVCSSDLPHPAARRSRRRLRNPRHQGKGRLMIFKRAVQRYGQTPEPETPYQRAGKVWDERIGSARVQARHWRLMAFGCLSLTGGLPTALVWQTGRRRIQPYLTEVD